MKTTVAFLAAASVLAAISSADAVIIITETDGLGANWVGTPQFQTQGTATPTGTQEGNWGSIGLMQTFQVAQAGALNNIQFTLSGNAGAHFGIAIYDLGPVAGNVHLPVSTTASYSVSSLTDLLGGAFSSPTTFTYSGASGGNASDAELSFSGTAVNLLANEYYTFELYGTGSTGGIFVGRTGVTSFTQGQLFRDRSALNGAIRDMVMAVTVPEPSTLALAGLGLGALALRRRVR